MNPLKRFVPTALGLSIATLSSFSFAAPEDYRWPYNQQSNVNYNVSDLERSYRAWKQARITSNNAGGNGRYRVMGGVNDSTTVSEGIAYGMILTSLFDDQSEFDGLWMFAKDHFNEQNVMDWYIGNPGQRLGLGGATDGEVDMAIALVNACMKVRESAWAISSVGIDYCTDADALIENIYTYEVDKPGTEPLGGMDNNIGGELMPGDMWMLQEYYPNGVVNLSYFPPGFFRVFGKFTGQEQKWQSVIDRNYALVDQVQAKPGNCSNLVPNWNQYNGDVQVVSWQPNNSGWWSYDAARFGWRIAVDALWYDSPDAEETVNELAGFFASVGINNMGGEYTMNGQRTSGAHNFFWANAAVPIVAASNPIPTSCGDATPTIKTTPQQAYDRVLSGGVTPTDYYGAYWRLISLLTMTGNFPNFYEFSSDEAEEPSVSLTSPADGDTFNSGVNINLRANASDNEIVTNVSFFVDGVLVGSDNSVPYSVTASNVSDGAHTVYAEATDNDGLTSSSSAIEITVGNTNSSPNASIQTSNTDGLMVSLSGAGSNDSDGQISTYHWSLGDGSSATGENISHTYVSAGTYSIELTVTDNESAIDRATTSVTVSNNDSDGSGSCEYVVANQWGTGFIAEIRISNDSNEAIDGWDVSWTYSDGTRMSSGWNTQFSGSNPYNASNLSWNRFIQPGQTATFGFQGNKGQPNTPAEVPAVTGSVCN